MFKEGESGPSNSVEATMAGIGIVDADVNAGKAIYYDTLCRRLESPAEGVTIVVDENGSRRMMTK